MRLTQPPSRGEALRLARASRGITNKALAARVGTDPALLSRVELDKADGRVGEGWWARALAALGLTEEELMRDPISTDETPDVRVAGEPVDSAALAATKRAMLGLRLVRDRLGWTQQFVAASFGIDTAYLSRLESGLHNPSYGVVAALAQFYGVSLPVLVASTQRPIPGWAWHMVPDAVDLPHRVDYIKRGDGSAHTVRVTWEPYAGVLVRLEWVASSNDHDPQAVVYCLQGRQPARAAGKHPVSSPAEAVAALCATHGLKPKIA